MSNYFSQWRKRKSDFKDNSTNTDIKILKEIVIGNPRCTGSKASWRVIPKDSCEIYKDRRKRQVDTERKKAKRDENEKNKTRVIRRRRNNNSKRITGKASNKQKRSYNRRSVRRERYDQSSSYTTDSSNYPTNSSDYTMQTSTSFSTVTSNSYCSSADY